MYERQDNSNTKKQAFKHIKDELSEYFKEFIEDEQKTLHFHLKKIIFNGSSSIGESEHKFLKYIDQNELKDVRYFIYSNDNDLIILLLQYIDTKFFVVFDDGNNKYSYIDISKVRNYFLNLIIQNNIEFDQFRVIDDFICLSFFLGNDYIPKFEDIKTDKENIVSTFDNLIEKYRKISQSNKRYQYLIEDFALNIPMLKSIFSSFFDTQINNPEIQKQYLNTNEGKPTEKKEQFYTNIFQIFQEEEEEEEINDDFIKYNAQEFLKSMSFTICLYLFDIPSFTYCSNIKRSIRLKELIEYMEEEEFYFDETIEETHFIIFQKQ